MDMDRATSPKATGDLKSTTVVHAEASAVDTLAAEACSTRTRSCDGASIASLSVPPGSIVASIVRDGEVVIPTGATMLAAASRIAVITLPRAARAV